MRKTFIATSLLLATLAVQPPHEIPSHTCRADVVCPKGVSAQNDLATPSSDAAPENTGDILIGYFGPADPNHHEGGDMWGAASLAIERANRAVGYGGRLFRLVPGWSENPWGSGVKSVADMAYKHNVCAIIGGIDGPSTHLAEQVVAKARLPLLSGANADRTANLANVSWMFSSLPGHHLQAAAMAETIGSLLDAGEFIVLSAVDHDSHLLTVELNKCFRKRKTAPAYHFQFKDEQTVYPELIGRIIDANARALVIIAPLRPTAHLCISLRESGFKGVIFGGPCMSRPRFVAIADAAAEGVIFPVLCESSKKADAFDRDFLERFDKSSDYLAAHTYDTVNILIEAIRRAGPDRRRIRDYISSLPPYSGVTGMISWDRQGGNTRRVSVGTISDRRVKTMTSSRRFTHSQAVPSTNPR